MEFEKQTTTHLVCDLDSFTLKISRDDAWYVSVRANKYTSQEDVCFGPFKTCTAAVTFAKQNEELFIKCMKRRRHAFNPLFRIAEKLMEY